ncbi:unnamed protein product [Victoria cruziana]
MGKSKMKMKNKKGGVLSVKKGKIIKQKFHQKVSSARSDADVTRNMKEDARVQSKGASTSRKIAGLIFMCNSQTKPECFRYRVFGLPKSKEEVVLQIKQGAGLFLYDFDLKLMYGIYKASSNGGMSLEPDAFGGKFPAQVKFRIVKDCLPVPESTFRDAIKDNYISKFKFNPELNAQQVQNLRKLFRPIREKQLASASASGPVLVPAASSLLTRTVVPINPAAVAPAPLDRVPRSVIRVHPAAVASFDRVPRTMVPVDHVTAPRYHMGNQHHGGQTVLVPQPKDRQYPVASRRELLRPLSPLPRTSRYAIETDHIIRDEISRAPPQRDPYRSVMQEPVYADDVHLSRPVEAQFPVMYEKRVYGGVTRGDSSIHLPVAYERAAYRGADYIDAIRGDLRSESAVIPVSSRYSAGSLPYYR